MLLTNNIKTRLDKHTFRYTLYQNCCNGSGMLFLLNSAHAMFTHVRAHVQAGEKEISAISILPDVLKSDHVMIRFTAYPVSHQGPGAYPRKSEHKAGGTLDWVPTHCSALAQTYTHTLLTI